MTCADCLDTLGPFIDGELPPDEAALVKDHLGGCADCAAAHRRLVETSSRVKGALMRYQAPDVLKARITGIVNSQVFLNAHPPVFRKCHNWLLYLLLPGGLFVHQRTPSNSIEQQVLASHIRSLLPGHLTDVASNDQHNVKPWFNGRVNMSPDVPRLDSLGFPLAGGRLDYVDGHNVAAVVYTRRQHVINVFSWASPGPAEQTAAVSSANGYHLIRARHNGLEIWIASDLNESELENFARMVIRRR